MKGCELCPGTARMYCESDQASLCFDCDAKVHGANFLVARHSRSLLCRSCQAPTPWKAAGPRLGPAFSVCDLCADGRSAAAGEKTPGGDDGDEGESGVRNRLEDDDNGYDDRDRDDEVGDGDDDDDDDDQESEDEEEGEEQVVPWTAGPPPAASSSSSEDEEESMGRTRTGNGSLLKRMRVNNNVDPPSSFSSQDQLPCSSTSSPSYLPNPPVHADPARAREDDEASSNPFLRPLKVLKQADLTRSGSHQPRLNLAPFGPRRHPN